ncbi:hypothetical protein K466DRAFT_595121 [Polyporus arcularius HHB13444]|uniref:Uncharacterized protein n=1 Tax=Polyporus arcularius HHB13444 TaxID=1314778 RepID=A0A5C3PXC8_9APHY|nr:hypothetical protein K466DRAFT_595121 [Polyporus arcularius HHB13444]
MPSSTAHGPGPPLQVPESRAARQSLDLSLPKSTDPSGKQRIVVALENVTGKLIAEQGEGGLTLHLHLPRPQAREEKPRLHPQRRQFKIRNTDRHVSWYYTEAQRRLDGPPAHLLSPHHQSLYVHKYRDDTQIWMYDAGKDGRRRPQWVRICQGHEHPDLDGYELHLLEKGSPRWVKNASARGYENVQRKRARIARQKNL